MSLALHTYILKVTGSIPTAAEPGIKISLSIAHPCATQVSDSQVTFNSCRSFGFEGATKDASLVGFIRVFSLYHLLVEWLEWKVRKIFFMAEMQLALFDIMVWQKED